MSLLERNIPYLPEQLGRLIQSTPEDPQFIVQEARDGTQISGIRVGGVDRLFHSRYAPLREADRIAESVHARVVIVGGAGSGYHVIRLLELGKRVLLFEPAAVVLRHFLSTHAVDRYLQDRRLVLLPDSGDLHELINQWYIPIVHGDLQSIFLPGRVACSPNEFELLSAALSAARESLQADIGTQARFGIVWMRNLLSNLVHCGTRTLEVRSPRPFVAGDVLVVAAGPSLDTQLPWIVKHKNSLSILSTDTALPSLRKQGVTPGLVVSIDASPISTSHFLSDAKESVPLAAEIAVPYSVFARGNPILPLSSANPLVLMMHWLGIPLIRADLSSGNVSIASVRFAATWGARSVTMAGADFAYTRSSTYARHTYVDRYFDLLQMRLSPAQTLQHQFLIERPGLRPADGSGDVYSTPALESYRGKLEALTHTLGIPLYSLPGTAAPLNLDPPPAPVRTRVTDGDPVGVIRKEGIVSALVKLEELVAAVSDIHQFQDAITGGSDVSNLLAARAITPIAYALRARGSVSDERAISQAADLLIKRVRSARGLLR
jgi:hypothetical protein